MTLRKTELARLTGLLDALGPGAMNIEAVDGYFAALACGPKIIAAHEALEGVLDERHGFANDENTNELIDLLTRHYSAVAASIEKAAASIGAYLPILRSDADGSVPANVWAQGFMKGATGAGDPGWLDLLQDDERIAIIQPIMRFAREHDEASEYRFDPIPPEHRDAYRAFMFRNVPLIHAIFALKRLEAMLPPSVPGVPPSRREASKIGRDDSCPCGSGRKFKKCCGAA